MKLFYPAVFIRYEDSFTVEFPDLPGCVTQGDSLEEAFEMAGDAACGWILTSIEDGEEIPAPTPIQSIAAEDGFVNYVTLDIGAYAKRYSMKSVKKTLSIPEWLNCLAEKQGINFSQELQHILKVRLGLASTTLDECVSTLQESTNTLAQLLPALSATFNQSNSSITTMATTSSRIVSFPSCMVVS